MDFRPVKLPADANSHKNIIEWWYFNGHLKDKNSNRYSFMDCLFQADLKLVNLPFLRKIPFKKFATSFLPYVHFAHSIISDIGKQKNYKEVQNISLASRDSFKRPLLFANYIDPLIILGYSNHEIAQTSAHKDTKGDTFHIKTEKIDLQLTARKPVLLEQGKGFVDVCGRKSYYYSYTDLEAKGILTLDGKIIEVEGKAWMDHQWADVPYDKHKWTWFSVQLDNGTDIMLTTPSVAATSRNWPCPVRCLATMAARIAIAACIPPPALSAAVAPGIIGGPFFGPVMPTVPPID